MVLVPPAPEIDIAGDLTVTMWMKRRPGGGPEQLRSLFTHDSESPSAPATAPVRLAISGMRGSRSSMPRTGQSPSATDE